MNEFTKKIELNYLPGHGWLASATAEGFTYIGEYRPSAIESLVKAEAAMNRHEAAQKENAA